MIARRRPLMDWRHSRNLRVQNIQAFYHNSQRVPKERNLRAVSKTFPRSLLERSGLY